MGIIVWRSIFYAYKHRIDDLERWVRIIQKPSGSWRGKHVPARFMVVRGIRKRIARIKKTP